jgi:hypothetical protein
MEKNPPDGRAGKTGKYLKYAIGEIILVVIGILIALSLNNWNENQKKRGLKNEYIVSLTIDFTKDTLQLNDRLRLNRETIKELALVKETITSGGFKTLENFKTLFKREGGIGGGIRIVNTYNTNSFNLLISSGNIDLLNKQLREDIMELNRLQNFQKEITNSNRDYYLNFMEHIAHKYPKTGNSFNTANLDHLLWKGVALEELPKDITSYYGQKEYTINRYIELSEAVLKQTELVLKQLHELDEKDVKK